jgi:hypothetical protein
MVQIVAQDKELGLALHNKLKAFAETDPAETHEQVWVMESDEGAVGAEHYAVSEFADLVDDFNDELYPSFLVALGYSEAAIAYIKSVIDIDYYCIYEDNDTRTIDQTALADLFLVNGLTNPTYLQPYSPAVEEEEEA